MKKILFTLGLVLSFTVPNITFSTSMRSQEFINLYNSDEEGKDYALIFINGAGDGIMWSNALLINSGTSPLYCRPNDLRQDSEGYYQIFKNEYFRDIKKYKDVPPTFPLLIGLIKTFPCN